MWLGHGYFSIVYILHRFSIELNIIVPVKCGFISKFKFKAPSKTYRHDDLGLKNMFMFFCHSGVYIYSLDH